MRRTAALAVLVLSGALCAQAVTATPRLQHRHELSALFTLDRGWRPVSDYDLQAVQPPLPQDPRLLPRSAPSTSRTR